MITLFFFIASSSLITYQPNQNKFILKKSEFKGYYKSIVKGTQKQLEKNVKLEAKSYHNFIICSLMRLKLAKVVHLNFLIIVNKRQKLKLLPWTWTSSQL